jgi:hypothetical protein
MKSYQQPNLTTDEPLPSESSPKPVVISQKQDSLLLEDTKVMPPLKNKGSKIHNISININEQAIDYVEEKAESPIKYADKSTFEPLSKSKSTTE